MSTLPSCCRASATSPTDYSASLTNTDMPKSPAVWRSPPSRGLRHAGHDGREDRKSTRLNSSHANISYAVFCLKKKKNTLMAENYVHHHSSIPHPLSTYSTASAYLLATYPTETFSSSHNPQHSISSSSLLFLQH